MIRVVVIACSKAKKPAPDIAARIYTGVLWQSWRTHLGRESGLPPAGWGLFALSAEHGLVRASGRIAPYDRKLTHDRVDELAPRVEEQWRAFVAPAGGRKRIEVAMIGGALYQKLARRARLPVAFEIDGQSAGGMRGGVGLMRARVGAFAGNIRNALLTEPDAASAWHHPDVEVARA